MIDNLYNSNHRFIQKQIDCWQIKQGTKILIMHFPSAKNQSIKVSTIQRKSIVVNKSMSELVKPVTKFCLTNLIL